MLILGIETSGKTASCAVYNTDSCSVIGEFTIKTEKTHSQIILPMCKKLLDEIGIDLVDIDTIAVSKGPGSYTGIRIGISAAKAMAFALEKKCSGVSELYSLAVRTNIRKGIVCSIIRARQNLVYCAVYKNPCGRDCEEIFEEQLTEEENLNDFLLTLDKKIILTGADSESFFEKFIYGKYELADKSLRDPNAVSLCIASQNVGLCDADELNASYLQLTEAERNLNEREHK